MAVSKKLTKQAFREWLQGYTPKSKVGYRDGETPVERYMAVSNIQDSEMPQWAVKYTTEIKNHPSAARSISANTALRTLDAIK